MAGSFDRDNTHLGPGKLSLPTPGVCSSLSVLCQPNKSTPTCHPPLPPSSQRAGTAALGCDRHTGGEDIPSPWAGCWQHHGQGCPTRVRVSQRHQSRAANGRGRASCPQRQLSCPQRQEHGEGQGWLTGLPCSCSDCAQGQSGSGAGWVCAPGPSPRTAGPDAA